MSLVERLFPPAELAAMKHAVVSSSDEPTAKRRKLSRKDSTYSRSTTDSGYNSETDKSDRVSFSIEMPLKSTTRKASLSNNNPASPTNSVSSPMSDEEDFCDKIARARARLYSNASLSIPSPPASDSSSPGAAADSTYANYHSPVCAEPATTSGCNLSTFVSLGMALTTHERNLLTTLVPEPKTIPSWQTRPEQAATELKRRLARLQHEQQQQRLRAAKQRDTIAQATHEQRRSSYAGFAISLHDEDEEELADDSHTETGSASIESVDDFFNIDAASEER